MTIRSIRPCLTFAERAEEAIDFYVSLFENSRVIDKVRSEGGPVPKGQLLHATFVLDGQEYTAIDGGPSFNFTDGFSLVASCETQAEIDRLWGALTSAGGEPGRCGWLKDRFGVSWQVIPIQLGELLTNHEGGDTQAAMEAMLKMNKLDIAALERAYRGTPAGAGR